MLDLNLPAEIESRLDALAIRTGRSKDEHIREAIVEHIENLEDVALAEKRLDAVRQGAETVPLSELIARHGMGD